jgi:hypothetical protein
MLPEQRGTLKTVGMWQLPVSYRALAMDQHGRVFGYRTMSQVRVAGFGYDLEGRVSIGGKKYRALTSSEIMERPDGKLCDVAKVYVCGTPILQWPDPLKVEDPTVRLAYFNYLCRKYQYATDEVLPLYNYCVHMATLMEHNQHAETVAYWMEKAIQERAKIAAAMGWEG